MNRFAMNTICSVRVLSTLGLILSHLCFARVSNAQVARIVVGEHTLYRDTPGQWVTILVEGDQPIAGANLSIISADGFPDLPGSAINGPKLIEVDTTGAIDPTVFSGNTSGQQDPGSRSQVAFRYVTTLANETIANGVLCHLVVDTTGVAPGRYDLSLSGAPEIGLPPTQLLTSNGTFVEVSIENGAIIVEDAVGPSLLVTAPESVEAGSTISLDYLVKTTESADGATVLAPFPENATWLGRGPAFEENDLGFLWNLGPIAGAAKLTARLELEPGSAQFPVTIPRARLELQPSGRVTFSAPFLIDIQLTESQLVQVILEEIPAAPAFDLNQDGAVNVLDLVTHTHETQP